MYNNIMIVKIRMMNEQHTTNRIFFSRNRWFRDFISDWWSYRSTFFDKFIRPELFTAIIIRELASKLSMHIPTSLSGCSLPLRKDLLATTGRVIIAILLIHVYCTILRLYLVDIIVNRHTMHLKFLFSVLLVRWYSLKVFIISYIISNALSIFFIFDWSEYYSILQFLKEN